MLEEDRQAVIADNKRKYRQTKIRKIRNTLIFIMVVLTVLVIPGLWIRHRVILAEKCSKLSYKEPTDVTREECGNLYFQTYEYRTHTGIKQRTIEPPETWCTFNQQGERYKDPC